MNHDPAPGPHGPPDDWKAAAAEFVQARIELVRHEAREAGRLAARRAATVAVILGGAVLFWLLTVAGLIGIITAARPDWGWGPVTLAAAGLHLLGALLALLSLRKPAPPAFTLTRTELAKDQKWLENLKNKP